MTERPGVLCIGEAMVLLTGDGGSVRSSAAARLSVAGAESNVARGLVHLGHSAEWFGRVGDDPFGGRVLDELAAAGVDVESIVVERGARTGAYVKEWQRDADSVVRSHVYYYRQGSAASRMTPADVDRLHLDDRRIVHLSGITPSLSADCLAFTERLLGLPREHRPLISFDVNHRPALWSAERAAGPLLVLARHSDIVFVGRDEAERLWGTSSAREVRDLLLDVPVLIVKDDSVGASCFTDAAAVFVPALQVEVVEAVGAGDAFAAGVLAGMLEGADVEAQLRLGHVMAAATLQHSSDNGALPPRAAVRALAAGVMSAWPLTADAPALPAEGAFVAPDLPLPLRKLEVPGTTNGREEAQSIAGLAGEGAWS